MPTGKRSPSSPERLPALIAGISGRALAACARRAGDPAIVLDRFADSDTASLSLSSRAVDFGPASLLGAARALRGRVRGLVYGAGFESRPRLLAELAEIVPLLGNSPEVVAAVKDPMGFEALLGRLGLPHPETCLDPVAAEGWLRKETGGAGGGHVVPLTRSRPEGGRGDDACYYQRRAAGRPVSACFVADGRLSACLGFSEQWTDGTADAPYRYGGCAGPALLPPALAGRIEEACAALVSATGLVGLNSLDLLVEGESFQVIEVNPRPGATLDIFDGIIADGTGRMKGSLWRAHLDAVAGVMPPRGSRYSCGVARAAMVIYAPCDLTLPEGMVWPDWAADRGRAGTAILQGEPVATVRAAAADPAAARAEAERRAAGLLDRLAVRKRSGNRIS